ALYRLLESWGVTPAMVAGHSIGELAAAHVAGVWSLSDACAVVGARGRLMQALPAGGAMLAVQAGEAEVLEVLSTGAGTDVSIAAVNGPAAVVVSGLARAVAAVAEEFTARGVRVRNLRVSHAFHSALMEPMLAEFAEVTASVSYGRPRIPLVSTVTGTPVTEEATDPEYWVRQVREPVRFADAVASLRRAGIRTFIEIGPDAVLSALGPEIGAADPEPASSTEAWIPTLRRDRDEPATLVTAIGQLHTRGGTLDWSHFYVGTGVRRVELPTYAFTRERFWLNNRPVRVDATELGQSVAGHPLLGAAVDLPDSGGMVLTGRLSLATHPWLADHRTAGRIVVPETALLEMAVRAGDETGHTRVSELQVHVPPVLPNPGALQVQVVLTRPDDVGRRELAIYARPEGEAPHGDWTRHVSGVLASTAVAGEAVAGEAAGAEWPPAGAQPQPDSTFRYVRALWRRGPEVFAEVTVDGAVDLAGFSLHPALLDAILPLIGPAGDAPMLAASWTDVVVHATGAARVRARLVPVPGTDSVSVTLSDPAGQPVASVGSVSRRPLSPEELPAATADSLFELEWTPIDVSGTRSTPAEIAAVGPDLDDAGSEWPGTVRYANLGDLVAAVASGAPVPAAIVISGKPGHPPAGTVADTVAGAARAAVVGTLATLQEWLAAQRLAGSRLVVLTHRAVDVGSVPVDVAGAAVWGLVRAAQSEYPGRIVLLDLDVPTALDQALSAALASGEAQVAVRAGRLQVPRLVQSTVESATAEGSGASRPGTLLVTGASGALGGLVARDLVSSGRAERVELLSRRGAEGSGLGTVAAELAGLGATTRVTACDAADRDSLGAVIAAVPAETPLRTVIHAAGVLDDGIIESLTPSRVEAVMRPKVDGAWNLHALTENLELDDFVLFSSMAGIWGNAGQGNYAAANSFLDALAARRVRAGLPAISLAWGPWQVSGSDAVGGGGGMTGQIEDADWRRMARHGLRPLSGGDGLTHLGAVIGRSRRIPATTPALLVPVNLDLGALRRHNGVGLPPLLSGLVGRTGAGPARRVLGPVESPERNGLAARLAALAPAVRERAVQDVVRTQSARVLGLAGPDAVDAGRSFLQLGLTSLTALELRNQLSSAAGLTLPASVIFDYPTPAALAGYLCANVVPTETALPVLDGLDRLASLLSAVDQDSDRRSEIIIRLEGMIADFRTRTADNATTYHELSVANDEEMFDLIDRELGI
ncbi:MAG TPA: SDR family NAD(P)-dependent oxidoreductase, partial [Pseudonocardia sp.]